MNRSEKTTLMMLGVFIFSALGLTGIATWLLQNILITPEIKATLFIGWLIGLVAPLPSPFNTIAVLLILCAIPVAGAGIVGLAASLWYSIAHPLR